MFKKPSSKKSEKSDTIEDSEVKIKQIKEKKKLSQLASKLEYPTLENELEEEENFIENIQSGTSKFLTKLKTRYDEAGTEFTPFNMSEEMEEGKFDETGHYLFHKRGADYDPWYDSVVDGIKEKEKALKSKHPDIDESSNIIKNITGDTAAKEEEDNQADFNLYGEEDLYYREEKITHEELKDIEKEVKHTRIKLIKYFVDETETVEHSIQRLKAAGGEKRFKPVKPQRKKQKMEAGAELSREVIAADSISNQELFKELIELVSKLTELSFFNVYSDCYEKIVKSYGTANLIKWKYRTVPVTLEIDNSQSEAKEYGEFASEEIKSWIAGNMLNDTDDFKIELKMIKPFVKESESEWMRLDDVNVKNILK